MTEGRLRILIVSAQFPFPPRFGFARRVAHLAAQLARQHDVTLLTYAGPADLVYLDRPDPGLRVLPVPLPAPVRSHRRAHQALSLLSTRPFACRAVESVEMQRAIDSLCARGQFDIVQLESSVLCTFRLPPSAALLIDEHNLEYEVFERMRQGERSIARRSFNRLEARRVRRFEESWLRAATGCAVTSDREEEIVRRVAPSTLVATVPNGVDLEEFRPDDDEVEPLSVVFNGLLRYRPNLDAARHLVEEVWPLVLAALPGARLSIVGKGDPDDLRRLARPGVVITGEVPDVRPFLARASVVAVPVRMGGGTRLKVIEALAMGKAIVTTTLGCEGVAVGHERELLVADGARSTADAIIRLLADPELRARLGAAGRRLAEQRYSWDDAGDRLDHLVRAVARARTGAEAASAPRRPTTVSPVP